MGVESVARAKLAQMLLELREPGARYVAAEPLTEPGQVAAYIREYLPAGLRHERVVLVCVDARLRPIGEPRLWEGKPAEANLDMRGVVQAALESDCAGVFLAHNHPTGDCTPSVQDRRAMTKLGDVLDAVGVRLFDSLVFGAQVFSMSHGVAA